VTNLSRRKFLRLATFAATTLALQRLGHADDKPRESYVTSFYQFNAAAIKRLSQKNALPNGPRFAHIFAQSTAGTSPHPELTKLVHSAGESFKFAWAYDAHKHRGWESASDDELKRWAMDFREAALSGDGAPDFFAFNEMPPNGHSDPEVRARVTKLVRYLHSAGGGPEWRGLFYFVEPNSHPDRWRGDATEFFETLDQTCDHVVAEHYHTDAFVFSRTLDQLSNHLFALAHWLNDSGNAAQINIAQHKYAPLHSSYWGAGYRPWTALYRDLRLLRFRLNPDYYKEPTVTPWEGMLAEDHDMTDLDKYFQRCVAATRLDELGKNRIAFSPLAISEIMGHAMLPLLARVLGKDAARFAAAQ
jgi:hypothetical protein